MIHYRTQVEIEQLRESALLVSKTLAEVAGRIRPGLSSLSLDKVAEEFIRDHGARPAFKGFNGFPASLCMSVNSQVVHGIPDNRELQETDIISVDCGVELNGYYGDSAYTFALAGTNEETMQLLNATKASLYKAIAASVVGNRIGDIGYAVQHYIESEKGYHVVRELVGHGVGTDLHEDPEIPNYGKRGTGPKLKQGLVIAIEPMVNLGTRKVVQLDDGWTIKVADDSPSAHFELMVAVGNEKADVLSTFSFLEEQEIKNTSLKAVRIEEAIKN